MTDAIVKIYFYYYKYPNNLSSFSGGEGPNQNEALGVMTPIHHPRMSHLFQGEGTPCGPKGRRDRDESPFPRRGRGTVLSHPKKGWGDRDESPKEGWGGLWWVIQKGRVPRGAPPITIKGRGWGQIMLMWGQSPYPTTPVARWDDTIYSTVHNKLHWNSFFLWKWKFLKKEFF